MEIKGKKILIFYPYGAPKHCGDAIVNELTGRGAKIITYNERPSKSTFSMILIRLLKKKVPQLFNSYISRIIRDNKDYNFDYVLVIRGEVFNKSAIEKLRMAYPNAYFILSLWDILETNNIREIFSSFDSVYSFDPQDSANNPGVIYRPMFYVPEYETLGVAETKYDVLFIGTIHSNRYAILCKTKVALLQTNSIPCFYMYIPSVFVYLLYRLTRRIYPSIFSVRFSPATITDSLELIKVSKCVLDINYPGQQSITMRAFEAMAAKKKYITTNAKIKEYPFYNENNFLVIDESSPEIPKDFLNSPYQDIAHSFYESYSVVSWVDDVFQINSSYSLEIEKNRIYNTSSNLDSE